MTSTIVTKICGTFLTGQYNAVLDAVVSKFMQKMSQLQHSRKRALLDGFAQAFQGTVEQLKQVNDCTIAKTETLRALDELLLLYKKSSPLFSKFSSNEILCVKKNTNQILMLGRISNFFIFNDY